MDYALGLFLVAMTLACVWCALVARENGTRANNILDELSETRIDLELAEGAIKLDRSIIQAMATERERLKDYVEFLELQILSLKKTGMFKGHDGKFRKKEAV